MSEPLYFDYAATTPMDPRVAAAMRPWLFEHVGNAGSAHVYGERARLAVEEARRLLAALLGATPREIAFTSGATESSNLAILGLARGLRSQRGAKPGHLVSSRIEHKSVIDPLQQLEREGHAVTWLSPDDRGVITPAALRAALRPDTVLVSIMQANNEIGVIQDIASCGALCRERGVALHVDGAQSVGKLTIDVAALQVDLLSVSAHKFYGPQGAGALYVRTPWRALLQPLQFGGGQERGLRSGTLPVHQIVGLGAAARLAREEQAAEATRLQALRERLLAGVVAQGGVIENGAGARCLPGVVSLSFADVNGEALVSGLLELALSTSAACNADSDATSYVLRALGRAPELAQATLRLSFGRYTTEAQIDVAAAALCREVARLRGLADLARVSMPTGVAAGTDEWRLGKAGDRLLGTQVCWRLQCRDGKVVAADFACFAAAPVVQVCERLAATLRGRELAAGLPGGPQEWARGADVPAGQLGRLLLVEDALRQAWLPAAESGSGR